jgi:hypothetical protein
MATDFGTDVSVEPDFDETWTPISGPQVLAERLVRRLTTPRGTLPFWPDEGTDIREFVRDTIDQSVLFTLRQTLVNECEKDEQVSSADATASYNESTSTITAAVSVDAGDGPFRLVLSISALSVDLLIPDTVS